MNDFGLRGKSVIVTGGTQGIGKATALAARASGALVTVAARTQRDIDSLLIAHKSDGFYGVATDVSSPEAVANLYDCAVRRFGRVDAVIHAAAVIGPIGRIGDVDAAAWWECVRIDLFGTFLIVAEACRQMTGEGGRIVLFSGGGATTPFPRYSAYASSKVAVARMVESVALEYADAGIEINAVAPGFVATKMHDETISAGVDAGEEYLERTKRELASGGVSPDIGAACACFLASSEASGISGRIVAAPWDDWRNLKTRVDELANSDLFTLRRIVPRDRGADWQ